MNKTTDKEEEISKLKAQVSRLEKQVKPDKKGSGIKRSAVVLTGFLLSILVVFLILYTAVKLHEKNKARG